MNSYFNSLTSSHCPSVPPTSAPTTHLPSSSSSNGQPLSSFYDTDYNRHNLPSNFDRLSSKDPLMGNYSNLNMINHPSNGHHLDPHGSTTDYSLNFPPSSSTSSSVNEMRSQPLNNFPMAVTNPMLYYAHPWMRPGRLRARHSH